MSRLVVGPFNRVEGDLEVKLEIEGGAVKRAEVNSPLYRGFERIMQDKPPLDALVYAPRICGICSVSQSIAAAKALASASGVEVPPNGRLATNLVHATENIADHLTHFYLFFMPDFARDAYRGEKWFDAAAARFTAFKGTAGREVLTARSQFMHLMGIMAGKWPHTLSIQPGGSSRAITPSEIARMSSLLSAFRIFLERSLFGGDELERITELDSVDALGTWAEEAPAMQGDFRHFLHISKALDLEKLGPSSSDFMCFGAYDDEAGNLFARGVFDGASTNALDHDLIVEDTAYAWYEPAPQPLSPREGRTLPDADAPDAYSWVKAPRLAGATMEVGAFARQLVDGHPLIRDLHRHGGGNVHSRVVARVLEIAQVTIAMERWVEAIDPSGHFINHGAMPDTATGYGLTEAARGSLGHWLRIEKGKIANFQIIAPTTWNFSPRDSAGNPGPLEKALENAPVREGEDEPVSVQHIIRSFDPCLVCTVH